MNFELVTWFLSSLSRAPRRKCGEAQTRLGRSIYCGRQKRQWFIHLSRSRRKDARKATELFSFEMILCMILLHSMKIFTIMHHLFSYDVGVHQKPISGPYPDKSDRYRVTPKWQKRSWWSLYCFPLILQRRENLQKKGSRS